MDISLKDKVAIITGGTRGIGFAMVKKFVEAQAKVVIWGSRIETAEAALEKLREAYPDCEVELNNGGQPVYYYLISVE